MFENLLYKRGFILSASHFIPPVPSWTSTQIGNYFISYDPDNSFASLQRESISVAILGRVVDTLNWSDEISLIAEKCLDQLEKSENNFFDYIDYISGRFIIVYQYKGKTKLMNDAFGMRSVFYSFHEHVVVASHCMLIRDIMNIKESGIVESMKNDPYWNISKHYGYPGNLTPYEDIYLLTPNTMLILEEKSILRFYPRKELSICKLDNVLEEIATSLRGQIELLNNNNKLAISLSAGYDSRVTLAAAKNIINNVISFTYGSAPNAIIPSVEIDMLISQDISKKLMLNHISLDYKTNLPDKEVNSFYRIMEMNTYWRHSWQVALMYLEQLPKGMLHIRSNLGEIGRAFYRKGGFNELPLTPQKMAFIWKKKMKDYKPAINVFKQFIETTNFNSIGNYDPYDMFYWEHRMGTWHSLVLLEDDTAFDTYILFNCRKLAEKMLSLPVKVRINSQIHTTLMSLMWPELLNWPVNPLYIDVNPLLNANKVKGETGINTAIATNLRKPVFSIVKKLVFKILSSFYKLMKKSPFLLKKRIRHIIYRNTAISELYKNTIHSIRFIDEEARLKAFSSNRKLPEAIKSKNQFILNEIRQRIKDIRSSNIKTLSNNYVKGLIDLNIAVIMDEFTYNCFKYEANLIPVMPDTWEETLIQRKPDLLFVESAWQGNNASWRGQVVNLKNNPCSKIPELVNWCNENNIPTVFWNKEDPSHYKDFIDTAKLFSYIFTTDTGCIQKYQEDLNHNRIYCLPFAIQPKIHNPIGSSIKFRDIAFAGSWYGGNTRDKRNRKRQMSYILEPALEYDVDIFDRQYLINESRYRFPVKYQPHILGTLEYNDMVYGYRLYKIFLNVNSVADSPTMIPRRVLEITACGTCVLSGESEGIKNILGTDIVKISSSAEETKSNLDLLLKNEELRRKSTLIGLRKIMAEHTCSKRLEYILQILNIRNTGYKNSSNGVSIITATNKPDCFENIILNYERQIYQDKELIIILNSNQLDLKIWAEKISNNKNIRIFQLDEQKGLGDCLNFGVEKAGYEFIAKFDDDDYYASHYLEDMMNSFKYSGADIVGKKCIYTYLEGSNILICRYPEMEYRYEYSVSGSTIIAQRNVFNTVKFQSGKGSGKDTKFLENCLNSGFNIFSADKYNYCAIRKKNNNLHTWKIDDEYLINTGKIVEKVHDYVSYVSW